MKVMRHKHVAAVADSGFGRVRAQGMGGSMPTGGVGGGGGNGGNIVSSPIRRGFTPYTFTIVVFSALIISYQTLPGSITM